MEKTLGAYKTLQKYDPSTKYELPENYELTIVGGILYLEAIKSFYTEELLAEDPEREGILESLTAQIQSLETALFNYQHDQGRQTLNNLTPKALFNYEESSRKF